MSVLKASTTWELEGWGESRTFPGRRGGFWSRHYFDTEKAALAEQKKQLTDQAWKKGQLTDQLKKAKTREAKEDVRRRFGSDHDREFPVFKVTREKVR